MGESGQWCLIESDPGVFTEMLTGFGVKGVQVEELYSLTDTDSLMKPVYGLIFLFKWRSGDETTGVPPSPESNVFFAQQVITNACATQALVNMLMNIDDPKVELGSVLSGYKEFSNEMDPATRGLCLSNCEPIRQVHNSFSRQTLYELDSKGGSDEDVYHFVTYLPIGNKVYELDGLREFPIEVAQVNNGDDWLDAVRPVITARMEKYSEGDIMFNLMALMPNRRERLVEMQEMLMMDNAENQLEPQIADLQRLIDDETIKMNMYRKENIRRRHNYLPFLIELMRVLAKEGKLVGLVDKAIDTAKQRAGALNTEKTMLELKKRKQEKQQQEQ